MGDEMHFVYAIESVRLGRYMIYLMVGPKNQDFWPKLNIYVQCNLDLVTLNLVTTCDLVTFLQRSFFNLLHKIIRFSAIM